MSLGIYVGLVLINVVYNIYSRRILYKILHCCCHRFDHYARDCYFNKEVNDTDKEEEQFAHAENSDFDEVILTINTDLAQDKVNVWYINTDCSDLMTYNKYWLSSLLNK